MYWLSLVQSWPFLLPVSSPKISDQSFDIKFLANHEWAKNDTSGSVIESLKTTVGLWARCTEVSTGHTSCDHYDNLLLGSVPILGKF